MTLQTIMDGSLPDHGVVVAVPGLITPSHDPRRGIPRKKWTRAAIAKKVGVGVDSITRYLRVNAELRALLKSDDRGRLPRNTDQGVTDDDVAKAGVLLLKLTGQYFGFAPKLRLAACIDCGLADYPHHHGGRCYSCAPRAQRIRDGLGVWADPRAWDKRRGLACCLVCARNTVKHVANGQCNNCLTWTRNALEVLTPREYVRAVARRRKLIARGRSAQGRSSIPRSKWERRR